MNAITPDWVKDAIFYQIFPDRFAISANHFGKNGVPPKPLNLQPWGAAPTVHGFQGGDLFGVIDHLDYLVDLGVNAIYLNPIFASASNHRYHTFDYFQVDPILGGNQALAALLDAAHRQNIRVVLDGVFNHASRGFFQFNHLLECGPESPYLDWFQVKKWPLDAYSAKPNYRAWWGQAALPEFNTDNEAVREFLWQVGTYWLEQGIDGWRLDVPNEIDDDSFWQEFRRRCKAVNPEAYIVGELWGEAERWLQGDQFDGQMNYLFTRAAFGFLAGKNIDQTDTVKCGYGRIPASSAPRFGAALTHIFSQLYQPEITLAQLNMLGSHDTPRLTNVVNGDKTAVSLLFLMQMTLPGAPNIYYGDEIGLPGGYDPDCRRAFPWQDESSWRHDLRADVKRTIQLRRDLPVLRRGDFTVLLAERGVVVYRRRIKGQTAVIAFNASKQNRTITLPAGSFNGALTVHLASTETSSNLADGDTIQLLPQSAGVWAN
ncbi:MAG: glycoside hydrolase family 13 protein [Chloroflexota bacterium]